MASSALFFFLFITLFLHTHARDSQLFNKVTSTSTVATINAVPKPQTNQQEQPQEQEPNFLPETENGYGLYGHETVQQTPSTAATNNIPFNKHLPKNYNPVSYVTEPENINDNDNTEFTDEKSYSTYYNNDQQEEPEQQQQGTEQEQETEFRSYRPTTTTTTAAAATKSNDLYYNGGGSSFNSRPRGRLSNSGYRGGNNNNGVQFQAQGMSDTRFLENGKYHYDIDSGRYSKNHPYETMKGVRTSNENAINKNYYNNNNNEINNGNSEYQNQDEFQGVDDEIYNDLP